MGTATEAKTYYVLYYVPVRANGYFFPFLRSGIEFLGVGKKVVRETPLENPPGPKKYSANHPRNPDGYPDWPEKVFLYGLVRVEYG